MPEINDAAFIDQIKKNHNCFNGRTSVDVLGPYGALPAGSNGRPTIPMTDLEARAFFDVLGINTNIENINFLLVDLSNDAFVQYLATAIRKNKTLKSLNLYKCKISPSGIKLLAAALKENIGLQALDLMDNKIDNLGAFYLDLALRNKPGFKLKAKFNDIDPLIVYNLPDLFGPTAVLNKKDFFNAPYIVYENESLSQNTMRPTLIRGIPEQLSEKEKVYLHINHHIISLLTRERARLRATPKEKDDKRIAVLDKTVLELDGYLEAYLDPLNTQAPTQTLARQLKDLVKANLDDNPELDKYKTWGKKLTRAILNVLFTLTVLPLLAKGLLTDSWFFRLKGKTANAMDGVVQHANTMTLSQ